MAAVGRTSTESLYRRFFAVRRHFSETEESFYLNVDFVSHVALVAVADENGQPMIIGGARYVVGEPGQAEVAFTVIDKYQGHGIGAALLRHLAMIARQAGLRELVAHVMAENRAMLRVFEKSGLKLYRKEGGWQRLCQVRFDVERVHYLSSGGSVFSSTSASCRCRLGARRGNQRSGSRFCSHAT
jgi:RimJ/RimL family protein N-acetyltransferase